MSRISSRTMYIPYMPTMYIPSYIPSYIPMWLRFLNHPLLCPVPPIS